MTDAPRNPPPNLDMGDRLKTIPELEWRTEQMMMTQRQGLLLQVDAIERFLGISPRTSELRKASK